jgi:hypothetical protein
MIENTAKKPAKRRAAKKQEPDVPLVAFNMDQTAKALGCSTPVAYLLIREGFLSTFTVGRKRYASARAIHECVAKLEAKGSALPMDSGANNGNSPRPVSGTAAAP